MSVEMWFQAGVRRRRGDVRETPNSPVGQSDRGETITWCEKVSDHGRSGLVICTDRAARKIVAVRFMATARNRAKQGQSILHRTTQLRAERTLASSRHIYFARVTRKSLRRAFFYRPKRHFDTNSGKEVISDTSAFNTAREARSLSFGVVRVRIARAVAIRQINGKSHGVRTMYLRGVTSATARFYM